MNGILKSLLVFFEMLSITVITEGALMLLLFRKWKYVYYSLLCNLLTNPALNLIMSIAYIFLGLTMGSVSLFFIMSYSLLGVLETAVVFIEAYVYKLLCGFKYPKALGVSALLNLVSFVAGLLIQAPIFRF